MKANCLKLARMFYLFLAVYSFSLNTAIAAHICSEIFSAQELPPKGKLTRFYLDAFDKLPINFAKNEKQYLEQFEIIFVPGFLNRLQARVGMDLFGEQRNWLKSQGIESDLFSYRVDFPEETVRQLSARIKKAEKPVFIVSHSMGSTIMLQLLVQEPTIRKQIDQWVSVNGTLRGSPLADLVHARLKGILPARLRETLFNQTEENLQNFIDRNQGSLDDALKAVPSVFVGTYSHEDQPGYLKSKLRLVNLWLQQQGYRWNDGLVPTENSCLGGMDRCIVLPQVDHFSTVKSRGAHSFPRIQFLRTLIFQTMHLESAQQPAHYPEQDYLSDRP